MSSSESQHFELVPDEALLCKGIVALYDGPYEQASYVHPARYGDGYLTSRRMVVCKRSEKVRPRQSLNALYDFAIDIFGDPAKREIAIALPLADVVEFGAASEIAPVYSFDLRDGRTYTLQFGYFKSLQATSRWITKILNALQIVHDQEEMVEL